MGIEALEMEQRLEYSRFKLVYFSINHRIWCWRLFNLRIAAALGNLWMWALKEENR